MIYFKHIKLTFNNWFYNYFGYRQIDILYIECSKKSTYIIKWIRTVTDLQQLQAIEQSITNLIDLPMPEAVKVEWLNILGKHLNAKRKELLICQQ